MKCPYCSSVRTHVIDKRLTDGGSAARRRRECLKCKNRFTTYERADVELRVVKKDGSTQPFILEKIRSGVIKACEKRPITPEQIAKTVEQIENDIRAKGKPEVSTKFIGQLVLKRLKKLDEVAYVRFASVYEAAPNIKWFEAEIRELKK